VKHSKNIQINRELEKFAISKRKLLREWLNFVAEKEGKKIVSLEYTLVKDKTLLAINNEKLGHDYYTDIITFDLADSKNVVEGDIYISYDRIKENAKLFHVKHSDELRRVLLHGLLHLLGYKDKTKKQSELMREKEDGYLNIYNREFKIK
jgi:rRNA maturation RNase YbeY